MLEPLIDLLNTKTPLYPPLGRIVVIVEGHDLTLVQGVRFGEVEPQPRRVGQRVRRLELVAQELARRLIRAAFLMFVRFLSVV